MALADCVAGAVVPGSFDQEPADMVLLVLVIDPCTRDVPEECSDGTSPTKAPMLLPVNRCQSPLLTASPKPRPHLTYTADLTRPPLEQKG
jgi:hypothetical protein